MLPDSFAFRVLRMSLHVGACRRKDCRGFEKKKGLNLRNHFYVHLPLYCVIK